MQEVSEEEEGCERGVPHSMCPWLFFAPEWSRWGWVCRAEGRGLVPGAGQALWRSLPLSRSLYPHLCAALPGCFFCQI